MEKCRTYQRRDERQSWDLPSQVGMHQEDLHWTSHDGLGTPTGHLGRILLRDSSDIGMRCLDIQIHPTAYQSDIPVAFLEAGLCVDSRLSQSDYGQWRFYLVGNPDQVATAPTVAGPDGYSQWNACKDSTCSICTIDDEYRGVWGRTDVSPDVQATDPVSLPSDYTWTSQCSVQTIREIAVPDDVASFDSACFCQEHPLLFKKSQQPKKGFVLFNSQDDLPSSVRPRFPDRIQVENRTSNATETPKTK